MTCGWVSSRWRKVRTVRYVEYSSNTRDSSEATHPPLQLCKTTPGGQQGISHLLSSCTRLSPAAKEIMPMPPCQQRARRPSDSYFTEQYSTQPPYCGAYFRKGEFVSCQEGGLVINVTSVLCLHQGRAIRHVLEIKLHLVGGVRGMQYWVEFRVMGNDVESCTRTACGPAPCAHRAHHLNQLVKRGATSPNPAIQALQPVVPRGCHFSVPRHMRLHIRRESRPSSRSAS